MWHDGQMRNNLIDTVAIDASLIDTGPTEKVTTDSSFLWWNVKLRVTH